MRFKTDENLHPEVAQLLCVHGHDAVTVLDQNMRGFSDGKIAEVCRAEGRALLTLDLDFADVRKYPPKDYPGLVVFRLRTKNRAGVLELVRKVLPLLETDNVMRRLWIVQQDKLRIRD